MRTDRWALRFEQRFWERVERTEDCWLWRGSVFSRTGYGQVWARSTNRLVHRVAYELAVGPIPPGLTIDHLCRVRLCVRPDHLEPVTQAENNRREDASITRCPNGHNYTPDNAGRYGQRRGLQCKTCMRARNRAFQQKRREATR